VSKSKCQILGWPKQSIGNKEGVKVRPVNNNYFYQFGAVIRPLIQVTHPSKYNDMAPLVYSAQTWVNWFLDDKVVPLSVCKGSGIALSNAINRILEEYQKPEIKREEEIPSFLVVRLTQAAREFETIFTAELQTLDTYFVSQTGIYKTSDLIEHAERIFPESILSTIPDYAVKDIRECGKCLAFNLPTSAGFHILRATEALIREYYKVVVGEAPKLKSRNWGRYIDILGRHGADQRILAALDQIREMHRNPIMHPEDFLTPEEAATLFGVAQGVIVFIAADIEKRKAAGPTLPGIVTAADSTLALAKPKRKKLGTGTEESATA
jgi:hypothetical protein